MKRMFKKKGKRLFAMLLAAIMTVLSMQGISFPRDVYKRQALMEPGKLEAMEIMPPEPSAV